MSETIGVTEEVIRKELGGSTGVMTNGELNLMRQLLKSLEAGNWQYIPKSLSTIGVSAFVDAAHKLLDPIDIGSLPNSIDNEE